MLGNRTALDMAFLETASCLVFKPQGMITLFQRKKLNGMQFVHFGLHLSQSPEKHSAFHDPYEQPDLPWHTGEGGGFFFFHSPSPELLHQPLPGRRLEVPAARRSGPGALRPGPPRFPRPVGSGLSPPPPTPAAFPGPDPGRRKFFPSSRGLASRDQPPPLPLPERESLKVTEEISMDTTTAPQECSAGFPAA